MLHKFRHLYPQGSLLSELVNLDQGLYVVKVTVKNQDVIWGSGLAAAETIEKAEDQARIRALMTLFTTDSSNNNSVKTETIIADPLPQPYINQASNNQSIQNQPAPSQTPQTAPGQAIEHSTPVSDFSNQDGQNLNPGQINSGQITPGRINSGRAASINNSPDLTNPGLNNLDPVNSGISQLPQQDNSQTTNPYPTTQNPLPDSSFSPEITNFTTASAANNSANNSTTNPVETVKQTPINIFDQPLDSPSTNNANVTAPTATAINTPMPTAPAENVIEFDFNEIKFKIDLEMKRLGWTSEQGRDYLLSTYGKRSRLHLKNEEILEFWRYLETLP